MPTISPDLIPTVAPGSLFTVLTTSSSLNIRWLTAADPVLFEALNRPDADIAVRQLVIAKTVDALNLRLSHQANFPFLIPAKVDTGTSEEFLPQSWIWDEHVSLPRKWQDVRLAKLKRISGSNDTTTGITGQFRFVFTAQEIGSAVEVSIFQADYTIDSDLTFQRSRVSIVPQSEESNAIDPGEAETISGFITFLTLDPEDTDILAFFLSLPPPAGGTDADGDGLFDAPAVYEIVDSPAGGESVADDFATTAISHGTGILVDSATNSIPSLDSDVNTWLTTFNFPFRLEASRTSSTPIVTIIPSPLFREHNICVPCGDEPTGDSSGEFSPVWISKIRRADATGNVLTFFFATFNVKEGSASTEAVEFATLTLERDFVPGQVIETVPINDLLLAEGSDQELFLQGFGEGHVTLSSLWGGTTSAIDDFFDSFQSVVDDPADVAFAKSATILGAPGALSRSSATTPTQGQFAALAGTASDLNNPVNPSLNNRYVVEADQGLGDAVDFRTLPGFTDNDDIEPIGQTGGLAHTSVVLIVNSNSDNHNYDDDILPRLRVLLGRDPIYADEWFDGTRFKKFTPQGVWVG